MKINKAEEKAKGFFLSFVLLFVFFFSPFFNFTNYAEGAINKEINYQGKLTLASGVAVPNTNYSIVFSLYTAPTGGTAIWSETRTVTTANGLFSEMLGDGASPLTSVNFNQTLYLGVKVGADTEMTPRKKLGAVPAAIVSETVTNAAQTAITSLGTLTGLTMGGTLQMNGNSFAFDQSGVRTWNLQAAAGNLAFTSGDTLGALTFNGNNIWHAGNDGTTSGLDADLLDGHDTAYFQTALTNPVTGTGTVGFLPKFTSTGSTIGDSQIYDNGANVGIGTGGVTPSQKLDVFGSIALSGTKIISLPDQSTLTGSLIYGTGGTSLSYVSGNNGRYNTLVGIEAGKNLGIGNSNTALGYKAGYSSTTGATWTALGYQAGYTSTTGKWWTATGYQAGYLSTTGGDWTANGYMAGYSSTTGSDWTAIGYGAGLSNQTGNNWVALGRLAGRYLADGTTAATAFSDSTYVGTNTKVSANGVTNENVFGYDAIGIGSNTVTLGNDLITTTALKGNVGIGTTTPLSKLSINGGLHVGGDSDAGDNNLLVDGTTISTGLLTASNGFTLTTGTLTLPDNSITNAMLAGSIANDKLANSTISGISLGSNLATLTIGTGLSGTSYNGGTAVTIASTITQYTDALARGALSLTTNGTSGAATYSSTTGAFNIPQYQAALTNPVTGTGTNLYNAYWTGTNTLGSEQYVAVTRGGTGVGTGTTINGTAITYGTTNTITADASTLTGTTLKSTVTGSSLTSFGTSPTFVTPALGTPASGNFSTGTFTWPTFNQNTNGTAAGLSTILVSTSGGSGLSNSGNLNWGSGGTLGTAAYTASTAYAAALSGTVNYVSKFTGTGTTIGNSLIFDNGTNVGIGTTDPQSTLDVNGGIRANARFTSNSITTANPSLYLRDSGSTQSGQKFGYIFTSMASGIMFQGNTTDVDNNTTTGHMVIRETGNVGIGTTGPTFQGGGNRGLHINNSDSASVELHLTTGVTGATGTDGTILQIGGTDIAYLWNMENSDLSLGTNATDRIRILANGNVGIGTTEPATSPVTGLLTVSGATETHVVIQSTSDSQQGLVLKNASDGNSWLMSHRADANRLGFYYHNGTSWSSELVTVLNTGNVGIGTTSPVRKLTVQGADSGYGQLRLMGTASQNSWWDIGRESLSTGDFRFVSSRDGVERTVVTIEEVGNVGIGTTGPLGKLQIKDSNPDVYITSDDTGQSEIFFGGTTDPDKGRISYSDNADDMWFSTANTERMRIQSDGDVIINTGNVGIGTTSPTVKLQVNGHCVTGDTLLPIRRRKKRKNSAEVDGEDGEEDSTNGNIGRGTLNVGKNQNADIDGEWEYLLVPIIDIKPGDEVLSLNKYKGKVEYHPIKGLMDMGVKDVYELRTKSGRVIRTTANHPYLARLVVGQVKLREEKLEKENEKVVNSEQKLTTQKLTNVMKSVGNYITDMALGVKISDSSDILTHSTRDMSNISQEKAEMSNEDNKEEKEKKVAEIEKIRNSRGAEVCPYCMSTNFVKRGTRKNVNQVVQLYLCRNFGCERTFSAQDIKGKHFPLHIIIESMSYYNIGLNLEETCKIIKQKFGVAPEPATLSDWINEYKMLCRYERLRPYAIKMFKPKDTIEVVTMAHRQLYRFRYHRPKTILMLEEFKNRALSPLKNYLDNVSSETPHQYFQDGERMSEIRSKFDKADMIVRSKFNYANRLTAFVLQSIPDNKERHEEVERFMLANDSCTVATEVPVYIRKEDVEHMENELKFKISNDGMIELKGDKNLRKMPRLLTGHIDLIQIRNGQIHLLDYKPNASKEKPIEQLTWYALAMSRLTGLRLYNFVCAWFDEKDYYQFYPLHVVKKISGNKKRRVYYRSGEVYEVPKVNELTIIPRPAAEIGVPYGSKSPP